MYHPTHRVQRRFGNSLRERRMRVDSKIDLFDRVLVLPGHCQLVNYLGGMTPDDVSPQDLTVSLVADDLYKAFGLTGGARPAVGTEGKAADLVIQLALLGLVLGQPDAGHFRVTVGDAGHVVVFDRLGMVS